MACGSAEQGVVGGTSENRFQLEGLLRCNRVEYNAETREMCLMDGGDRRMKRWTLGRRDTTCPSLCWDDWLDGKREAVDELLRT